MIRVTSIGDLDERIVIERNLPTQDAANQPVPVWSTFKQVWTRAVFLSGRELEAARHIVDTASVVFTVGYRLDVTEQMRVVWRAKHWNINAIQEHECKDFVDLIASRVD